MTPVSNLIADVAELAYGSVRAHARRKQLAVELRLLPKLLGRTVPRIVSSKVAGIAPLPRFVARHAQRRGSALALVGAGEQLSFGELDRKLTGVARALRRKGLRPGDRIVLLGRPSPSYLAILLGAARAGIAVALPSAALRGELLCRALVTVQCKLVLAQAELASDAESTGAPVLRYGDEGEFERTVTGEATERFYPAPVELEGDYVYIFTSGTTGFPKACRVTHDRALLAATVFSELVFEFGRGDRLYAPLPLNHSSALLLGAGSCLAAGVPLIVRSHFSASEFWPDVVRYDATAVLYIGELCRALVAQPPRPEERQHHVRVAVGNGLSRDVWHAFRDRFGIAHVREFYAATDVPSAIVNLTDEPGSVGHVPMRRTRGFHLLRVDPVTMEPVRDRRGRGVECASGEPGELVLRVKPRKKAPLGDVPLYTEEEASRSRLLRDLFEPGDCYYRSFDILVADEHAHVRFVERVGDSFRYKGENVSCAQVEELLRAAPGVRDAAVVGLKLPGVDGSPPLAALVTTSDFSWQSFWQAVQALPPYAQPCFVRLVAELPVGETLKVLRRELAAQGADPSRLPAATFIRESAGYRQLTTAIWAEISAQTRRL